MKDIERAMQEEQAYLAEVAANSVTQSLISRLTALGYNSLQEYFDDKRDYHFKSYDYEWYPDVSIDTIWDDVFGAAARKQPAVFIHKAKFPFIWIGTYDKLDEDKVKEFGYEVRDMQYGGGNIINGVGDLSGAFVCFEDHEISAKYFEDKFFKFLSSKLDGITRDNNDILQHGKKIMSGAYAEYNGMLIFMFQSNFSNKYDIIEAICGINPDKQPGYITDITADELKEEVLSWARK